MCLTLIGRLFSYRSTRLCMLAAFSLSCRGHTNHRRLVLVIRASPFVFFFKGCCVRSVSTVSAFSTFSVSSEFIAHFLYKTTIVVYWVIDHFNRLVQFVESFQKFFVCMDALLSDFIGAFSVQILLFVVWQCVYHFPLGLYMKKKVLPVKTFVYRINTAA